MNTATAMQKRAPVRGVSLGFHLGNVLTLLADRYPKLQRMILEQIQNALDANSTKVSVRVDLKDRTFEISDNGIGASENEMKESFAMLGKGRKDMTKFGRFGIGVVSGFGKGNYFTFTSCVKGREDEGYLTWTFYTKKIQSESSGVIIPCEQSVEFLYWPDEQAVPPTKLRTRNKVPWRTRVKINGLRKDARLCEVNLNQLKAEIASNFGKKMLDLGTVVKIRYTNAEGVTSKVMDVVAEAYSGQELPVYKMSHSYTGDVFFRMYLARSVSGKRNGTVNVSIIGNPFRINARACLAGLVGVLDKQAYEDLTSGVFEGDIECSHLTLKAERDGFMDDDFLIGLCEAIEKWYSEVGSRHVLEIQNSGQDTLFQETGIRAMRFIEALCRRPEYSSLVLSYLKEGTIGPGHINGPTIGTTDQKVLSTDGGGGTKRNGETDGEVLSGSKKRGPERKNHIPGTVAGPRGSKRRQVRGHSVGLRYEYAQLTADRVYEFEVKTGVLRFNTAHEYWQVCEKNKATLSRYQATVAQIVLSLLPYVESAQYDIQLDILLDYLSMEVLQIVDGDAFFTERNLKRHSLK